LESKGFILHPLSSAWNRLIYFFFYELITALEAIGTVYSWGGGGDHPPQERAGIFDLIFSYCIRLLCGHGIYTGIFTASRP
jgi:hypothetical protein